MSRSTTAAPCPSRGRPRTPRQDLDHIDTRIRQYRRDRRIPTDPGPPNRLANLVMDLGEHAARFRSLVRDRAGPFAGSFDTVDAAGLLEPLSVGICARRRAAVAPGSSVLVTGASPFA